MFENLCDLFRVIRTVSELGVDPSVVMGKRFPSGRGKCQMCAFFFLEDGG